MTSRGFSHVFTVDVEMWHDGIPSLEGRTCSDDLRFRRNVDRILHLLDVSGAGATFFWLGKLAERHPDVVRKISSAGHETGCHGWDHLPVGRMTPAAFREKTCIALDTIASITGEPVLSYRAPFFSVTAETLWALDILAEQGIRYDSSILTGWNWRYWFPDFSGLPDSLGITEVPVSTIQVLRGRIPSGGGAWFRMLPFGLTDGCFRKLEEEGTPGVFYVHPWELDPGHPVKLFSPLPWLCHYWRLSSTEKNLGRMMGSGSFSSIRDVFEGGLRYAETP